MANNNEKKFYERISKLPVDTVVDIIKNEAINYGDVFAKRLGQNKDLEKWLFQHKTVNTYQTIYVRNEEGHMKHKNVQTTKVRPTSNGHDQICYLIDLANKYDSFELLEVINKALPLIIAKTVNEDAYFKVEDVRNEAKKTVMEVDFREIGIKYLQLPLYMQDKNVLLSFFEHEDITSSLIDNGYTMAKILITEFGDELLDEEINKLTTYIYSRLERMEEQIISIDQPALTRKADELISKSKLCHLDTTEIKQTINELKKCDSDVRHNLKAKYNRELSRYFKLLKPIYEKHELDADDINDELADLYLDLNKTYEIINDELYVNQSRKHDEQIKQLEIILTKEIKGAKTPAKKKFSVVDIWDRDKAPEQKCTFLPDRDGGM